MDTILNKIIREMEARHPRYAVLWHESKEKFGADWEAELVDLLTRVVKTSDATKAIVDGYAEFCTDALRAQIFFEKHERYKASNYAEVSQNYYHNKDFMMRAYLPGMLLSHYVWPHHYKMLKFFRAQCSKIPAVETFAEVGVGCGMYSKEAAVRFPSSRGWGYDISRHSLNFTAQIMAAFGCQGRYETHVRDIIADTPNQTDLVICQEVLEHLEDPPLFLKALRKMTKPGGYAYISAAVNAGHVDHIYLYRSPDQVGAEITSAGYRIVAAGAELAYQGKPLQVTPCHAAFLCVRDE